MKSLNKDTHSHFRMLFSRLIFYSYCRLGPDQGRRLGIVAPDFVGWMPFLSPNNSEEKLKPV